MSQVTMLRRILSEGHTVTQRSALLDYGIMALPRRIADLKERGFPVSTTMRRNPTTGQRFAEYRMAPKLHSFDGINDGGVYAIQDLIDHPFNEILEVRNGTKMRVDAIRGFGNMRQAHVTLKTPDGQLQLQQIFLEERLTRRDFSLVLKGYDL